MDHMIIAPCGMNCSICSGYLREKNRCLGCTIESDTLPTYCSKCIIRNCSEIRMGETYCYECSRFPCTRLKALDKRYRSKYGMSMLENQESIRILGIEEFARREELRWKCPGCEEVLCVHKRACAHCGYVREMDIV